MKKGVFRKGDKVFDIRFGWGIVVKDRDNKTNYPISVEFDSEDGSKDIEIYTSDGKSEVYGNTPMLSFTEYSLQNFSQKRVINYKDYIGEWGIFYDEEQEKDLVYKFGKLQHIQHNSTHRFNPKDCIAYYEFFEPLTEEQIEILGLTNKNVD